MRKDSPRLQHLMGKEN